MRNSDGPESEKAGAHCAAIISDRTVLSGVKKAVDVFWIWILSVLEVDWSVAIHGLKCTAIIQNHVL